jgi:hypothetical protein
VADLPRTVRNVDSSLMSSILLVIYTIEDCQFLQTFNKKFRTAFERLIPLHPGTSQVLGPDNARPGDESELKDDFNLTLRLDLFELELLCLLS